MVGEEHGSLSQEAEEEGVGGPAHFSAVVCTTCEGSELPREVPLHSQQVLGRRKGERGGRGGKEGREGGREGEEGGREGREGGREGEERGREGGRGGEEGEEGGRE